MSSTGQDGMGEEVAADFVRRFAEFWRAPAPERLGTVLAERVRLSAPMAPTTTTLAEGKQAFADLFELIPDLTAEVHRWGATKDGVLIEFTASGTAAGGPVVLAGSRSLHARRGRPCDRARHLL